MKSGVFFERDGLLARISSDGVHLAPPGTCEIDRAVKEPLRRLKEAGLVLLATANLPGLSRGDEFRRDVDLVHDRMLRELPLDEVLVCPHDELDDCPCRKPKPGLLIEAAFKWHLDLDRCYVVSDRWQDAEAAHNAGCTSLLIDSPRNGHGHHDYVMPSLEAAAAKIVRLNGAITGVPGASCVGDFLV